MIDFGRARQAMVDGQIRAGGVTEPRLLARLSTVPREQFVPAARRSLAYVDDLHWFGRPGTGRFMAPPATLAKLLHLADIAPTDRVLHIGATSGYASAVLAGMASQVTALEQDPVLAAAMVDNIALLGLDNVQTICGTLDDLSAPSFDLVFVEGMIDAVSPQLLAAVADGGRLVALIRKGPIGVSNVISVVGGAATSRAEFSAFLPPLVERGRDEAFVF